MAVGTYNLPICDGCKLPWLPVGWTQDSDPRNPDKPLRCGKCKSIGWDREFVKQQKAEGVETPPSLEVDGIPANADVPQHVYSTYRGIERGSGSEPVRTRCAHRMTDCPICHPKEAA